jgi:hypothetical protein
MCYSPEISLITFIIGILGSLFLYLDNFKSEAFFYGWVVLMQLVEYFIWKNQPCNDMNKKITNIGMFINNMEPIVLWISILLFSNKILPLQVNIYMVLLLLFTIIYTKKYLENPIECTSTTPDSKPYLQWNWNRGNFSTHYYAIFLIGMILLSGYGLNNGLFQSIMYGVSFIISYYLFGKKKSIGNIWCFLAAFMPWLLILYRKLI